MNRPLPILATLLGLCGLIPFIACAIASLGLEGDRAMLALVAYGAVVLAFLGGVHWGFALADPADRGERQRLVLGVLPSLVGWIALLLTIAVQAEAGLALLVLGFLGTTIVEARARNVGLVPPGYMRLRYGLSAAVILVLVVVLFLRLIGAHITL
jgi:Protein of unknown function (DUF3429)